MLTDAADQAADSRKAELDELLAGPIDDSDDGVPTANPYQLMAQLGSVMEQALAVRCTAQTIDTALTQINGDITPVADTFGPMTRPPLSIRRSPPSGKSVI